MKFREIGQSNSKKSKRMSKKKNEEVDEVREKLLRNIPELGKEDSAFVSTFTGKNDRGESQE